MDSRTVELYKRYAPAFSAASEEERREILQAVVEEDVVCRIPRLEGRGLQILLDDIQEFQTNFPGGKFAVRSVSEHHDVALMEWQLILADGTESVRGHDAIRVSAGGKIAEIVTFAPSVEL